MGDVQQTLFIEICTQLLRDPANVCQAVHKEPFLLEEIHNHLREISDEAVHNGVYL